MSIDKIKGCLFGMAIGDGWIAEESFATALLCFLYFPNNPTKALQRAVLTAGDSDSIACLAGAFVGANCGYTKLSQDWTDRIEYKAELLELSFFFQKEPLE
ncbi:MAG: ADP-ribosylglycohydrolase family protein [Aureispira sp.]|nr:ADP-ribosylglycohydrolase family protein [Aureispira sp.]